MEQQEQAIREGIVQAARSQKGVPYKKDTHLPGVALDCVGLLQYSVAEATGLVIPSVSIKQGSIVGFVDRRLPEYLAKLGCTVHELYMNAAPGDFVVWIYGPSIVHTGIVTGRNKKQPHILTVIHSCAAYGGVVEHNMIGEWSNGRRLYGTYDIGPALVKLSS